MEYFPILESSQNVSEWKKLFRDQNVLFKSTHTVSDHDTFFHFSTWFRAMGTFLVQQL